MHRIAHPWIRLRNSSAHWFGCLGFVGFAASLILTPGVILAGETITPRSAEVRLRYVDQAATWRPIETEKLDLLAGPSELIGKKGYQFGQTISCTFIEPDLDPDPFGNGQTPKFHCLTPEGRSIKVKYGLRNSEVYAEVAGSRLLWSLGFGSDTNYSVRVECDNCPKDPWTWITMTKAQRASYTAGTRPRDWSNQVDLERRLARGRQVFLPALVEVKFKGDKIESRPDQGWNFSEFRRIYAAAPAEPSREQIHRDALALLLATIGYGDSKDANQRLVCLKAEMAADGLADCRETFLIAHDLGWTFGYGYVLARPTAPSKMRIDHWRELPVFRDAGTCLTEVHPIVGGTLKGTRILEAARQFLVARFSLLSRSQKVDIFRAARVEYQQFFAQSDEKWGTPEQWADVLDEKFAEIGRARCPK
jgi:hypothetical protein